MATSWLYILALPNIALDAVVYAALVFLVWQLCQPFWPLVRGRHPLSAGESSPTRGRVGEQLSVTDVKPADNNNCSCQEHPGPRTDSRSDLVPVRTDRCTQTFHSELTHHHRPACWTAGSHATPNANSDPRATFLADEDHIQKQTQMKDVGHSSSERISRTLDITASTIAASNITCTAAELYSPGDRPHDAFGDRAWLIPSSARISDGLHLSGDNDLGKKLRVNSSSKTPSNVQATAPSTADARGVAQKEIVRLEYLCEARTKELTHAKIQLKATIQGFDAMAVLVNYCCAELNAFECPILAEKLATVQRQLTDCLAQISELTTQKEELNKNLSQVIQDKEEVCKQIAETLQSAQAQREEHAKMTKDMDDTHNAALTTQRDELTTKHEEALKKFLQYYDKQIEFLKQSHERQLSEIKNESKLEMNGIRISHLEEIQELRNKHDSQMEELHKQHRNKLEDITHRFETIKLSLSEKVESLRGECEDLRHRARNSEEALQRDADVKVQMALAPFMSLPAEIESLKTVVEMRNEEIQKLRTKNMDLEKQLEEVPIGREKIISLQQKVENLEAIINIKTDHEKQMHEHCQVLMRKYDRASRANKRLSMDYEQVMWRMSQSSEFGSSESLTQRQLSKSPTRSDRSDRGSPDGRHRTLSPSAAGEVVMRKKRNSQSVGEGDQKLRSRSATFVLEKHDSSDSHSPSSSPQPKLKRWRKKSEAEEKSGGKTRLERMCRSAGAELISDLVSQEAWAEKEKATLPDAPNSLTSSIDNTDSYSRSVSGVSDSGVYDSMSRSDMLNSSVVSTDSEWATSVNLSMNLDSTMDDLDSGPKSGDYVSLNDVTVMSKPGGNKSLMKSSNTVVFCMDKNCDPSLETSKAASDAPASDAHANEFTRPETADDVFDESISMESSCCSFDNFDVTSASDSRLTSGSEDMSANETVVDNVSDVTLTCNISLEKSPQISSVSQSK